MKIQIKMSSENTLRTLKDLKEFDEEGTIYSETYEAKTLKAEAVKWVKHGDYTIDWFAENRGIDISDEKQNWRLWIINFFNLTEDDLK